MSKLIIVLMLATASTGALADERSALLDRLAATLRHVRALPAGTKTALSCPANLDQLRGASIAAVIAALSDPDYAAGGEYAYVLASPALTGQRGGGVPGITFVTTKSGIVDRVSCTYSR